MKKYFVILLLLTTAITTYAQVKQTVTKAAITFRIKNLGLNTSGFFSGLKADIQFAPANLAASSITATVDANTVNTDNDSRDEHLRSDSYFDVTKFPKITMKSIAFKHKNGDNYTGTFNLIIKDKTNAVEVPFTYTETGGKGAFNGIFKIQRTDYGVGSKSMIMSNDVTITLDVETSK